MKRFKVIVCCQGNPTGYMYKTLIGALCGYAYHYLRTSKYNTMNVSLKQIF